MGASEFGIVDIHSHILHGVDDGAKTIDESQAMLALARESGTVDIVASPHSNLRYRYDRTQVEERIASLQPAAGPRIHRGCDFHLHYDNIRAALDEPQRFSINGAGSLLVEFSDERIEASATALLDELREAGLTLVITHPERNPMLRERRSQLKRWVESGCLLQITGGSLTGRFGKSARAFSEQLLREHMVHFVASDAHDLHHRTTDLRPALEMVRRNHGESVARLLFSENGAAALRGLPVEGPKVTRSVAMRPWFRFLG